MSFALETDEKIAPGDQVSLAEYVPLNQCSICQRDFTSCDYFDRHRVGKHEHLFSLEHPEGRRCMDEEEILASGLRCMTEDEMRAKYASRIGSGVPLYFDPVKAEATRAAFGGTPKPVEALAGVV